MRRRDHGQDHAKDHALDLEIRLLLGLSYPDKATVTLLATLQNIDWQRDASPTVVPQRTRGGQRRPGVIAKAVLEALASADDGLRFAEIAAQSIKPLASQSPAPRSRNA